MTTQREWSMEELAGMINETIRTDKDFVMAVSGETGSGKSTLAIKLAKRIYPDFNIKRDIIYSREELIARINDSPKFSVIIMDEAINALFRRDFMKKQQKYILRLFDMCRDKNLVVILCVPVFWSIDKHLLESKVKLRLHIERTGLSFMFKPTNHPHSPDIWARKYNLLCSPKWDYYPDATRMIGFLGILHFGDLGAEEKRIYLEDKRIKKLELAKREEEEEKKVLEEKQRIYELGKMEAFEKMRDLKLLKDGALQTLSRAEGWEKNALSNRLSAFKRQGIKLDSSLFNQEKRENSITPAKEQLEETSLIDTT